MKLRPLAFIVIGLILAGAAAYGIRATIASTPQPPLGGTTAASEPPLATPRVVQVFEGPPVPKLEQAEAARALEIALSDTGVRGLLQGKQYTIEESAVWHEGERKIGVGVHLKLDRPYQIEYDWPTIDYDAAKYPFPHYREATWRAELTVTDLYIRVDLAKGKVVDITATNNS